MKKILLLTAISFLVSCNQNKKPDYKNTTQKKTTEVAHLGEELLKKECYTCHSPSASEKERVAPPMIAIKAHYINKNITKEKFTNNFINFVKRPTKEKAKLNGAIKRFGLMPYQDYKEENLKQIAEYLYDYQIEEPSWFNKHWKDHQKTSYINSGKKSTSTKIKKSPADIGLGYALGTKKVLGKNLMGTIQQKGTLEALKFCNHKAYPLTDSMAVKFNATIKRVSDKPRNPKNKATPKELAVIELYKKLITEKSEIKPITEEINGKTQFYYPIKTNSMCLQCHGKSNKQIKPAILKKLTELYPKDKAINYDINQVRGIWSITFKK